MPHGEADDPVRHRAVVERAVILDPGRMLGVGVQVARRDVVVLAIDHPTQAREVAFRLIGARPRPCCRQPSG